MKYLSLLLPLLFIALFAFALVRRVRLYDCFTEGVKGAIPLLVSHLPLPRVRAHPVRTL